MIRPGRCILVAIIAVLSVLPVTAHAGSVESHLSVGRALFTAARYREAIDEFRAAQAITPMPELELAIARCHDALGELGPAVVHYSAYLRAVPHAPDAPAVRKRMRALKVRAAAADAAAPVDDADVEAEPDEEATEPAQDEGRLSLRRTPVHRFGFGFGLGGGYQWAESTVGSFSAPSLNLLDISFFFPVNGTLEFQLFIPLANVVINSLINGPAFQAEMAMKFYTRGDSSGFFIAPGLAVQYQKISRIDADGTIVGLPLRIGYEAASRARGFGFSIAAKPSIGILMAFAGTNSAVALTYGVVGEISFNFYSTRR